MSVTVYRSTDASAPVLTGSVGDLIALLDACLVNGYGSKTAAGWSKPFTATNKATFRPGSGVQHYFDVDDSGPGVGVAKEARIRGFETMTAVATGTGPFPTVAQQTNGLFIRKSATADATARVWAVIADDRTAHVLIYTGDTAGIFLAFTIGEFYSLMTDNYRSILAARATENSSTTAVSVETWPAPSTTIATASAGHYAPRSYTQLGTAVAICKGWNTWLATSPAGSGSLDTPNAVDGAMYILPMLLGETTGLVGELRGRKRGVFVPAHKNASLADGQTIDGSGAYAGHVFTVFASTGSTGTILFDTTGPWDTN
jgi:hypothetical protein